MKPLKIAVVGAGAIGAFYGSTLARAGHEVHFLLRSNSEAVAENGFFITTPKSSFHCHPVQTHSTTAEIGACDLVIIALKTTANALFPSLLPPLYEQGRTTLLTLQNGMGNVEALAAIFGAENVAAGLCSVCINRSPPCKIDAFELGVIQFAEMTGPARQRTHALAALFEASGTRCKAVDSLNKALWLKLCWNIPFNALAILGGNITTDRIIASPTLRDLAQTLMHEVAAAANANGAEITEKHIATQLATVNTLGAYKPSSLIDHLANRPLEIDSIWGEPLRRARAKNIPTPTLACIHSLLTHLNSTRTPSTAASQ
ncbi:MAG: 2-dehydropantoate 2-reductase [Puniceicoccales bacterium]|jgi:2-dehydropantoate 2-reductase|nr:2-dehydropantoate 2-reductase [Puniceicoccales bacterium]